MSVQNITNPDAMNSVDLYCDTLHANNITGGGVSPIDITARNVTVTNLLTASGAFISNTAAITNIILPTSGGTPSLLNYYEVDTTSLGTGTWNGSTAGSFACPATITRIGNIVSLQFNTNFGFLTGMSLSYSPLIPARFRPSTASAQYRPMVCQNNNSLNMQIGTYAVTNSGNLIAFNTPDQLTIWQASCVLEGTCLTWTV